MVEPATVRRLVETIEQRLLRLESARATPLPLYIEDPDLQAVVERNLQVCIQACIDLGLHLLADLPAPLPETSREVFRALGSLGAIEPSLAAELERMAGFRNILVHGYAALAPEKVHGVLSNLDDVREYVRQVTAFINE